MPANVPANFRVVSGGNTRGTAIPGGWQTLEEWDADGEPAIYASYVDGCYIDEVLSMRKDPDGSGSAAVYYFHQDDLFNVVLVTDDAGDAAERYEAKQIRSRFADFSRRVRAPSARFRRLQPTIGHRRAFEDPSKEFDGFERGFPQGRVQIRQSRNSMPPLNLPHATTLRVASGVSEPRLFLNRTRFQFSVFFR